MAAEDAVFVHLVPFNDQAKSGFNEVCEALENQPDRFQHHAKFMVRTGQELRHTDATANKPEGSCASIASDPSLVDYPPDLADPAPKISTGYYALSLRVDTEYPRIGWRAGYGRDWPRTPTGGVDLLLATEKHEGLRACHATFSFNKEGLFTVSSRHTQPNVWVGANALERPNEPYSLAEANRLLLTLGPFTYLLQHRISPGLEKADERAEELLRYFTQTLHFNAPHIAISATPTPMTHNIGKWTIHSVLGAGFSSTTRAATRHGSGESAAFKQFLRLYDNDPVDEEIRRYTALKHVLRARQFNANIWHLEEVAYSGATDTCTGSGYAYLFFTPLPKGTLADIIICRTPTNLPVADQRARAAALLLQGLQGLRALYDAGWVHRNINPWTLGLVSLHPPRAVILDLGQARCLHDACYGGSFMPEPGAWGMIGYLAPEMEDLSCTYGTPVDIWALGYVGYALLPGGKASMRTRNPWVQRDRDWSVPSGENREDSAAIFEYYIDQDRLAGCAMDSLEYLLSRMLMQDPSMRISAAEAIAHPAFRNTIEAQGPEGRVGDKRPSSAM